MPVLQASESCDIGFRILGNNLVTSKTAKLTGHKIGFTEEQDTELSSRIDSLS
jgi:hypothetical protein